MLHSNISRVLEKNIKDEELLNRTKGKFHDVEIRIDNMLKDENVDLKDVLREVKMLIERIFGGVWTNANWKNIELDVEKEIEDSKRK